MVATEVFNMPRPWIYEALHTTPEHVLSGHLVMKIDVISETHLRKRTAELFQLQHSLFADVSIIFHAGDLTELEVLEVFSGWRPFMRKASVGILTLEERISGQIINP